MQKFETKYNTGQKGQSFHTYSDSVLGETFNFYKTLYSSQNIYNTEIDNFLSKVDNPILSEDDKNMLEKFPTFQKCTYAVNNIKADKSLGLDGLPCEFYKYFWKQVRPNFYDAL